MMPRVTIITVVRNDKQHIRETILSALAQTGVEVQYLVLDGASTDGTADIMRLGTDRSRGTISCARWSINRWYRRHNTQF